MYETFLSHIPRETQRVLSTICLHMDQKAHVACNFNYLFVFNVDLYIVQLYE